MNECLHDNQMTRRTFEVMSLCVPKKFERYSQPCKYIAFKLFDI